MKLRLLSAFAVVLAAVACSQDPLKDFDNLPKEADPVIVGNKVSALLLGTKPEYYDPQGYEGEVKYGFNEYVQYSIISIWVNAMEFARNTGDAELEGNLINYFEPFYGEKKAICNRNNHVDFTIFGALPLEIYILNKDKRAYDLGMAYADHQWETPDSTSLGGNGNFSYEEQLKYLSDGYTPQTRLWIDDMYMINALQTQAYRATGDIKYIERAAKEMVLYLNTIQNPDGLFDHAPGVPFIWGRGDGWMAAGMPMLLKYLPEDNEYYPEILEGYKKMMASLLQYQHENGLWGQLVTDSESWEETSGSAMFTYGFIEGIKHGWLDAKTYGPAARKAWIKLCSMLDEYGNIADVCPGTNRKNSREWYLGRPRVKGDPHGEAPLMWICNALTEKYL